MSREICKNCGRISPVGFSVPDAVWEKVVPLHHQEDVLCVLCFAMFADEEFIRWDEDIKLFPVSLALHVLEAPDES